MKRRFLSLLACVATIFAGSISVVHSVGASTLRNRNSFQTAQNMVDILIHEGSYLLGSLLNFVSASSKGNAVLPSGRH